MAMLSKFPNFPSELGDNELAGYLPRSCGRHSFLRKFNCWDATRGGPMVVPLAQRATKPTH